MFYSGGLLFKIFWSKREFAIILMRIPKLLRFYSENKTRFWVVIFLFMLSDFQYIITHIVIKFFFFILIYIRRLFSYLLKDIKSPFDIWKIFGITIKYLVNFLCGEIEKEYNMKQVKMPNGRGMYYYFIIINIHVLDIVTHSLWNSYNVIEFYQFHQFNALKLIKLDEC